MSSVMCPLVSPPGSSGYSSIPMVPQMALLILNRAQTFFFFFKKRETWIALRRSIGKGRRDERVVGKRGQNAWYTFRILSKNKRN